MKYIVLHPQAALYPQETQKLVLDMYHNNERLEDIAKAIGITSLIPIRKFLKEYGLSARSRQLQVAPRRIFDIHNDNLRSKIWKLYYEENLTMEEISLLYDTNKVTVKNFFKKCGWIARPNKGDDNPSRRSKLKKLRNVYKTNGYILCDIYTYQGTAKYVSSKIAKLYLEETNMYDLDISISHLDHMLSIHDAYYNVFSLDNPLTMEEVCHPCNLLYVKPQSNLKKNRFSKITPNHLRTRIKEFNSSYGNPFIKIGFSFEEWTDYHLLKEQDWKVLDKPKFMMQVARKKILRNKHLSI